MTKKFIPNALPTPSVKGSGGGAPTISGAGISFPPLPSWADAILKEDTSGSDWKTEEGICFSPPYGTSTEYVRARVAFAEATRLLTEADARLANAKRACSSLGIGLYALRPPLENLGVVAGEVYGWRVWQSSILHGTKLQSIASTYLWKENEVNEADADPTESNNNGLWACKTREQAIALIAPASNRIPDYYTIGQVKMWGKIVEHEHGYRARYAKIVSLEGKDKPNLSIKAKQWTGLSSTMSDSAIAKKPKGLGRLFTW